VTAHFGASDRALPLHAGGGHAQTVAASTDMSHVAAGERVITFARSGRPSAAV
jgi:hypothetical protein